MKMYSVKDQKSEAFMRPFFLRTHGEALRSFFDEVENRESMIGKHPEDFVLFYVGEFDESSGVVRPCEAAVVLARASDAPVLRS